MGRGPDTKRSHGRWIAHAKLRTQAQGNNRTTGIAGITRIDRSVRGHEYVAYQVNYVNDKGATTFKWFSAGRSDLPKFASMDTQAFAAARAFRCAYRRARTARKT